MSDVKLTGSGAPTRMTVGVVGQHYEDLNTGNIYECLVASEQSKLNGAIGGGYVWKLKYTGADRADHEAIFGAGNNSVEMAEYVMYQTDNAEFIEDESGLFIHTIHELYNVPNGTGIFRVELDGEVVERNGNMFDFFYAVGNASLLDKSLPDTNENFVYTEGPLGIELRTTSPVTSIKISMMGKKVVYAFTAYVVEGESGNRSVTFDKTFEEVTALVDAGERPTMRMMVTSSMDGFTHHNSEFFEFAGYTQGNAEQTFIVFKSETYLSNTTSDMMNAAYAFSTYTWCFSDNSLKSAYLEFKTTKVQTNSTIYPSEGVNPSA